MSTSVQDDQEVVAALALLDCAAAKNGTISESDVSIVCSQVLLYLLYWHINMTVLSRLCALY
jgi:hypothetical protein